MENRMMILFFMLLSLFLLFSAASALLTVLRRKWRRRLPSAVWGILFLLPILPYSIAGEHSPLQLELTVDAQGGRVVSVLPAEEEKEPLSAILTAEEDGSISLTGEPADLPAYRHPDGLYISARVWSAALYLVFFALFLWLTLALASVTHRICAYAESIRYLTSRSAVCHDERICAVFQSSAAQVKLHRKPVLRIVEEGIHLSPCTSGLFTPTVYISHLQSRMASDELEYIFLHELCHVKRHDFFLKILALFATAVHFPAPFAGDVRRMVYEDCELGCDRMVLSCIGISRRSRYMQTILEIAEQKLRSDVIRGELFSYASGAKELLLRRYRNLLEPEKTVSPADILRLASSLAAVCLLHVGLFSLIDPSRTENPMIRFENPYLETVVREYYNLRDNEPVTMSHLDGIWSLEFSLSRKTEKPAAAPDGNTLALCCTVNEGKYYMEKNLSGDEWAVFLLQDGLADGISPDMQYAAEARRPELLQTEEPLWLDPHYDCAVDLLPDVCTLAALERYLPEDREEAEYFLSRYTCLDGTESALDRYVTEIYMTVIRENRLTADAPESDILDAFTRYCGENGITFDPDKGDILGQLRAHRREEIIALSPAALIRPMAFLDPDLSADEIHTLVELMTKNGKINAKCMTGITADATGRYTLALTDLNLFGSLRTVILNDRLVMEDKTILTEEWCAVIERS
ncbi:MAG: M56 family metallopeptidase [Clostridia bacterium]|nr:M56 family metallopeptidase [Clostridia bacterium]